ncbi:helix-turn-helix domain-containing protein [Anoxynatronum sibiricum]|uniref:Helix-turn-helix domain-containing protein n=1 Tax=Anoxynatronum sibiricum TaxID=210623 RepID=A0ABU9VWC8_9CLOT
MEKRYLVEEVAMETRRPVSTIWRWIREGKLEAVRTGKRYLIAESALNDFLNNGTK